MQTTKTRGTRGPLAAFSLVLCTTMALWGCKGAEVSVTGPIEYSLEPVEVTDYLKLADENARIEEADPVDASRVGTQTIEVRTSSGLISGTREVDVLVQDMKAPQIELSHEKVSLEFGESFDPTTCVASVSDPVDGALGRVEQEPETSGTTPGFERFYDQGWYLISSPADIAEAGTHAVEVIAADRHGNRSQATITVEVVDPLDDVEFHKTTKRLEYGTEDIDPLTLVTCSDDEVTITAEPFSAKKVGKVQVDYTLKLRKSERTLTRTFYVRDTREPQVVLGDETVTVEVGSTYDPASNVVEVTDPVDGALKQRTKEPKKLREGKSTKRVYKRGWYTVSGSVDTATIGTYPVTVQASDKHGNLVTTTFNVAVVNPLEGATISQSTSVLEYALSTVDVTRYLSCSVDDATITADTVDLSVVGEKEVLVVLTKGANSATGVVSFTVQDTQGPNISLRSSSVRINAGSPFDAASNVSSVSDPVDGSLRYVSSEPTSDGDGWYTVTGNYSTTTAGSYYLTVVACDRNGNRTSRDFTLTVS